jgi:parallel beta-helix repeat protein
VRTWSNRREGIRIEVALVNVTFTNVSSWNHTYPGMLLQNSVNCTIINSSFYNNSNGIEFLNTNWTVVRNSLFYNNTIGMKLGSSYNNMI